MLLVHDLLLPVLNLRMSQTSVVVRDAKRNDELTCCCCSLTLRSLTICTSSSSSFKLDKIYFKALRYSDENDEENLSVVHVGVGDLGSLQNLHLIL